MVDTIFEIGGQDSKFISIENRVVVDFAMNEACAAGTGSFLEEQAEKLAGVFSGQMGGPMASLAPLIGQVLGIEQHPVEFRDSGHKHHLKIGADVAIDDVAAQKEVKFFDLVDPRHVLVPQVSGILDDPGDPA